MCVFRALLNVCRALLCVFRALLNVYKALLCVFGALLNVYRALLCVNQVFGVYTGVLRALQTLLCSLFFFQKYSVLIILF